MFEGRTVAVIGGSSGIGFRVAELAIAQGARAIVGSRSKENVAAATAKLGAKATGIVVDNREQVLDLLRSQRAKVLVAQFDPAEISLDSAAAQVKSAEAEVEPAVRARIAILAHAVQRAYSDARLTAEAVIADRQGIGSPRRPAGPAA